MTQDKLCNKCLAEDEQVLATHHCSECNQNYCGAHLHLHNTSNKTKSHAETGKVSKILSNASLLPSLKQHVDLPSLSKPKCSAIDLKHGSLFVANDLIIVEFDVATKKVKASFKEPQEDAPFKMCYDPNDNALVYCIDRGAYFDITKVSRDGKKIFWSINKQSRVRDMCIDRHDGSIYTIQKDGVVILNRDGKVTATLREDVCGQNMFVPPFEYLFGITTDFDNNLLLTSSKSIIKADKTGNVISRVSRVSPGAASRLTLDPSGQLLYYIGDEGLESTKLDGSCLTLFKNENADSDHKFELDGGEGLEMGIDFTTGEFYVTNVYKRKVQVFK